MAELALLLVCLGIIAVLAWRQHDGWDDTPWICECVDPTLDDLGECADCRRPHPSTLGLDQ